VPVAVVATAVKASVDRRRVTDGAAWRVAAPPPQPPPPAAPARGASRQPRARRRGGAVRGSGSGGGGGAAAAGRHPPYPRCDQRGDPASSLQTYILVPISRSPRS